MRFHIGGRRNGKTALSITERLLDAVKEDRMFTGTPITEHPVPLGTSPKPPPRVPLYARNGTFTIPTQALSTESLRDFGLFGADIPSDLFHRRPRFLVFDRNTLSPIGLVAGSNERGYRAYSPRLIGESGGGDVGYLMLDIKTFSNENLTHDSESDAYRAILGHALGAEGVADYYNDNRYSPDRALPESLDVISCPICTEPVERTRMFYENSHQRIPLILPLHLDSLVGKYAMPSVNPFVCVTTPRRIYGPFVDGVPNQPGQIAPCQHCGQKVHLTGNPDVSPKHVDTNLPACAYVRTYRS